MTTRRAVDPQQAAPVGDLTVEYLGTVTEELCHELEAEWVRLRQASSIGDHLGIAEHFPVYSSGRGWWSLHGDRLKLPAPATLSLVDGWSPMSFNGPGTLTAYLIVKMRMPSDVAAFTSALRRAVTQSVESFGLETTARRNGLFVGHRRVARSLTHIRRNIAATRISVDVATRGHWREALVQLGSEPGTSMAQELGSPVLLDDVAAVLGAALGRELNLALTAGLPGVVGPGGVPEQ